MADGNLVRAWQILLATSYDTIALKKHGFKCVSMMWRTITISARPSHGVTCGQGHFLCGHAHGRAVQVDPIKPNLKPPGTKLLKLKCDVLLSTSAFKFNCAATAWRQLPGRAVQVDPIKPTLKAPGSKRLKLEYEEMPSSSAVKFNLRRYSLGGHIRARVEALQQVDARAAEAAAAEAGAYTRPRLSST